MYIPMSMHGKPGPVEKVADSRFFSIPGSIRHGYRSWGPPTSQNFPCRAMGFRGGPNVRRKFLRVGDDGDDDGDKNAHDVQTEFLEICEYAGSKRARDSRVVPRLWCPLKFGRCLSGKIEFSEGVFLQNSH